MGSFTALIFFGTKAEVLALAGALFFLAFLAGTAAALLALYRLSVMEMLSKND